MSLSERCDKERSGSVRVTGGERLLSREGEEGLPEGGREGAATGESAQAPAQCKRPEVREGRPQLGREVGGAGAERERKAVAGRDSAGHREDRGFYSERDGKSLVDLSPTILI